MPLRSYPVPSAVSAARARAARVSITYGVLLLGTAACGGEHAANDGTGAVANAGAPHGAAGATLGSGGVATERGGQGAGAAGGAVSTGGSAGVSAGAGTGGSSNAGGRADGGQPGGGHPSAGGTAPGGSGGSGGRGGTSSMGGVTNGGASGAGGAGTSGSAGTVATAGTNGGSSCAASKLAKGNTNLKLSVGGAMRTYILHVPTSYTGTMAVPLVLDFHALGGTGSQEQSSSGYQAIADKQGFLIAFPDGIDNAWNIGPCCTNSRDVDDLGFAKAMIASIEADGCVDTKRVYATGFSMGGGMSQYLACNAADLIAAVTPASFDLLVPDEEPCAPSRPISVLAFRGTADTVVPFGGGQGSSGRITFLGAQGSFERWAGIDGCMEPTTADGDCTYYKQCDAGVELGLCVKQGGSHAPGDANAGWAFLSRFTLP